MWSTNIRRCHGVLKECSRKTSRRRNVNTKHPNLIAIVDFQSYEDKIRFSFKVWPCWILYFHIQIMTVFNYFYTLFLHHFFCYLFYNLEQRIMKPFLCCCDLCVFNVLMWFIFYSVLNNNKVCSFIAILLLFLLIKTFFDLYTYSVFIVGLSLIIDHL